MYLFSSCPCWILSVDLEFWTLPFSNLHIGWSHNSVYIGWMGFKVCHLLYMYVFLLFIGWSNIWDRPCLALRSESLAWNLRIDPSLVHCHDHNRDGVGLSSADVHSLCSAPQLILAKCLLLAFYSMWLPFFIPPMISSYVILEYQSWFLVYLPSAI